MLQQKSQSPTNLMARGTLRTRADAKPSRSHSLTCVNPLNETQCGQQPHSDPVRPSSAVHTINHASYHTKDKVPDPSRVLGYLDCKYVSRIWNNDLAACSHTSFEYKLDSRIRA